jgi:N-ethylmaleimide reductase
MPSLALFEPTTLGKLSLKNRIVMAPMTRCRAVESNAPNQLMADYYAQRASAGLIITEGTSPAPNGTGYARIPGLWNKHQVAGWKKVTDAVHKKGGRIVVQLMHTGRIGHVLNLPAGAEILAPSAVAAEGTMYTDAQGAQPYGVPRAMSESDVWAAVDEYRLAAQNAMAAGFDGVELHAANGYLLEQFLSPHTNQREDAWGGSVDKRIGFVIEVAKRVTGSIGGGRVGIRLSPYGNGGSMKAYPEIDATYVELVTRLVPYGLQYIHLVDHSSLGAPKVPEQLRRALRRAWPRTMILAGGLDRECAETALRDGKGDLFAFGRPFIANPDLVDRLERKLPLATPDAATFYTPGPKGYTDYPMAPPSPA